MDPSGLQHAINMHLLIHTIRWKEVPASNAPAETASLTLHSSHARLALGGEQHIEVLACCPQVLDRFLGCA